MSWAWIVVAVVAGAALAAAGLELAKRLRARSGATEAARPTRRVLFPFLGSSISRPTLDAALRIARAEGAVLVPAYLATVPRRLSLEAPIPKECDVAMPLLETIEQRAGRLDVAVDSRIERGRTPRHALLELLGHEHFDRIVLPAQTRHSEGFPPDDVAYLLEHVPGEILVLRPQANGDRSQQGRDRRAAA